MSLTSKAAVITGSTSGIGLAIARALAKEGASVVLNGFGPADEIEKTRASIEQRIRRQSDLFACRHGKAARNRKPSSGSPKKPSARSTFW